MKTLSAIILFIVGISLQMGAQPDAKMPPRHFHWQLGAYSGFLFGETAYTLKVLSEFNIDPGNLKGIRSTLTFPLDVALIGISASWRSSDNRPRPWSLEAVFSVNANNPSNSMTDMDWIDGIPYSSTQSEAKLDLANAAIAAGLRLKQFKHIDLSLLSLLSFQEINQRIIGYEGWVVSQFDGKKLPVAQEGHVIDYKANFLSLQFGLSANIHLAKSLNLKMQSAIGPMYAADRDDHLLRAKLTKAKAFGYACRFNGQLIAFPDVAHRFPVSLFGQLHYSHAYGTHTASWSKDGNNVKAGTVIHGIPQEFKSIQLSFGLSAGFVF